MKTNIVQIGNSQGIRIPKPLLQQCGLVDEVELHVRNRSLIISPLSRRRHGWAEKFRAMAVRGDDALLDPEAVTTSSWDAHEWQWK